MDANNITNADYPYLFTMDISYWEQILTAVFLTFVSITGLIGNSMIIAAVAFSKKLQTATNAFVTSLSVADLLTCFTLIWYTVSALGKGEWPIPRAYWLCQFTGFMIYACIGTSMWTLGVIAVNRLIHILNPVCYHTIFTSWKLAVLVIIPWTVSEVFLIIMPAAGYGTFGYNNSTLVCAVNQHTLEGALAQNIVGLFCPLVAIVVSYMWIYVYVKKHFQSRRKKLDKHSEISMADISTTGGTNESTLDPPMTLKHAINVRQRTRMSRQQIEITKNLFLVVCGFFACFLPYFILQLIRNVVNVEHYIFYAKLGPFANSTINFVIYASNHPNFKVVLRHMMRCSYADIPQPSPLLKYLLSRRN